MDLEGDRSTNRRRFTAERNDRYGRAGLCRMAAISYTASIPDYRLCLDTTTPMTTIAKSQKTGTVTFVVVRSGSAELGKWLMERRNVAEDYTKIFGESPDNPRVITISSDSNDTPLDVRVLHWHDCFSSTVSSVSCITRVDEQEIGQRKRVHCRFDS